MICGHRKCLTVKLLIKAGSKAIPHCILNCLSPMFLHAVSKPISEISAQLCSKLAMKLNSIQTMDFSILDCGFCHFWPFLLCRKTRFAGWSLHGLFHQCLTFLFRIVSSPWSLLSLCAFHLLLQILARMNAFTCLSHITVSPLTLKQTLSLSFFPFATPSLRWCYNNQSIRRTGCSFLFIFLWRPTAYLQGESLGKADP